MIVIHVVDVDVKVEVGSSLPDGCSGPFPPIGAVGAGLSLPCVKVTV